MTKKLAKKSAVSTKKRDDVISNLDNLSRDELHELILINTYKLALTRAQIDAIVNILIKKGTSLHMMKSGKRLTRYSRKIREINSHNIYKF